MSEIMTHYVPKTIGEIMDHLADMTLTAPQFADRSGLLPGRNIDTAFAELIGGLENVRKQVGEESYTQLIELSARMRSHFEADPLDKTEDGIKGRECIYQMEDI